MTKIVGESWWHFLDTFGNYIDVLSLYFLALIIVLYAGY